MTEAELSFATRNPSAPIDPASGRGTGRDGFLPVLAVLLALASLGWGMMAIMIIDMMPRMDMQALGPGMGVFNAFGPLAGLSADLRAALTVLCLPTAANGGLTGWTLTQWTGAFAMWAAMALAMMMPSSIPMLRRFHSRSGAGAGTSLLVLTGYLTVWLAYAVAATGAQWLFNTRLAVLTPAAASVSLAFSASILIAAGIYQFTPLKQACLVRCWYPRFSIGTPEGSDLNALNAVKEGYAQGLICLGCCAAVMMVMFAVGVMNILWMAALGVLMAIEKSWVSTWFPRVIGLGLLATGAAMAALIRLGA